jgi:hypothetical protein
MPASNSPGHIVGNHVLLRLCVPRYPPSALCSLTTKFIGVCDDSFNLNQMNLYYLTEIFFRYAVFMVLAGQSQQAL